MHIILGRGVDCRKPLVAAEAGGIFNFTDAAESTVKDSPFKECYEPLVPASSSGVAPLSLRNNTFLLYC